MLHGMTQRLLAVTAAVAILGVATAVIVIRGASPSPSPAPTQRGVDWRSKFATQSFVGTYHAVRLRQDGAREEVTGRVIKAMSLSNPSPSGSPNMPFGSSVATASLSAPMPKGPCVLVNRRYIPTLGPSTRKVSIWLIFDLKRRTYGWVADSMPLPYEEGGYSPRCGGFPMKMGAWEVGGAEVGNLPLPSTTDVLCGKAIWTIFDKITTTVSWRFYPKGGNPGQASVCPTFVNPGGGTQGFDGG